MESAKLAKEKLERDYERFRRKEELQRKIQVGSRVQGVRAMVVDGPAWGSRPRAPACAWESCGT